MPSTIRIGCSLAFALQRRAADSSGNLGLLQGPRHQTRCPTNLAHWISCSHFSWKPATWGCSQNLVPALRACQNGLTCVHRRSIDTMRRAWSKYERHLCLHKTPYRRLVLWPDFGWERYEGPAHAWQKPPCGELVDWQSGQGSSRVQVACSGPGRTLS